MRTIGGEPTVMCRSDAFNSTVCPRMSAKSISISIFLVVASGTVSRLLIGTHGRTRYSRDLLDRGEAHAHLVDAVLLERAHALLDRDMADCIGSRALDRHVAD